MEGNGLVGCSPQMFALSNQALTLLRSKQVPVGPERFVVRRFRDEPDVPAGVPANSYDDSADRVMGDQPSGDAAGGVWLAGPEEFGRSAST